MKVLVVFTYGYSLKTWEESGTLKKELEIYDQLSKKFNIEYTFLTYGDIADLNIIKKTFNFDVIPVYSIVNKYKNTKINILMSFFIPFKLFKKIDNFDLIKQNQLLGSWVSIILKLLTKKPLFLRTGYDMYQFSKYENKSKLKVKLYKYLTKFSFYLSDLYSVSSNTDFIIFKEQFKNKSEKLVLRPNLISTKKSSFVSLKDDKKILCVGRLEHQKNFEFVITEFANTDYVIDIVGEGREKAKLKNLAEINNVNLNFLGRIENEKLNKLYFNYKYFVNASIFEGNPKTVLEALSKGCIVFLSNIPNHTEIITDKLNGYIFDLKKDKLISLFKNRDYDLDENISQNGISLIAEKYSLRTGLDNEYGDYKRLLGYY
mgnify:CR=1 FL=1